MSKKKQRIVLEGFTFKVDKLIIEQESEIDEDPSLQQDVRHVVVERLISAPAQLLALEANGTERGPREIAVPVPPPIIQPMTRRRRTRRRVGDGTEVSAHGDMAENFAAPRPGAKPNSARSLILELHGHGFFAQDRSIAQIREELHTRGHSFKSNEISPTLLALTQRKILARRKDDKAKWTYRASSNGNR